MQTYILYGGVWCCWCGLHSCLISAGVARALENNLGSSFRFYRLLYNIFSTLSLSVPLLFGFWLRQQETPVFIWDGWSQLVRYGLLVVSLLLFFSGARRYRLSHFLGIAQIRTGETALLPANSVKFQTTGVSGMIRHPWYLGGILLVWSGYHSFSISTLISGVIISCYFIIGSVLEERKLLAHYGNIYRVYQQQVSMLLPVKWFVNRIRKINRSGS